LKAASFKVQATSFKLQGASCLPAVGRQVARFKLQVARQEAFILFSFTAVAAAEVIP
jgi:hypothetical protein